MKTTALRPSLLGLILLLSLPAGALADDFTYTTNNGTITIASYTGPGGEVIIPASVGALPVTTVGTNAFASSTNITKVLIPDSVTTIAAYAFYACKSLTNVAMANGLLRIDEHAFGSATALTNVAFPITLTSIGEWAFSGCRSISSIQIPAGVTNLGIAAFASGSSLVALLVDDLNSDYSSAEGVLFNKSKTYLAQCPGARSNAYSIPNGVSQVGSFAFTGCANLTSVGLPDGLRDIGFGAFQSCSKLTDIAVPGGVTNIGNAAFVGCSSLSNITLPDSLTTLGIDVFMSCRKLASIIIPNGVGDIGSRTFLDCTGLTNATIGTSVRSIGDWAFYGCTALRIVKLPTGLLTVGDMTFNGCRNLIDITLSNKLTSIGTNAFQSCIGLTNLMIPSSVVEIGSQAFFGCGGLTNVSIGSGLARIGSSVFAACQNLVSITVDPTNPNFCSLGGVLFDKPRAVLFQYSPALNHKTYTVPAGVTTIAERAFRGSGSLTNITMPMSLVSIENYAFDKCTNLSRVFFQGNAPTIGLVIFAPVPSTLFYQSGTTGWTSPFAGKPAVLWDPMSQMTYATNANAISITGYIGSSRKITIPELIDGMPVRRIETEAFVGYNVPTIITIPASVTSIANAAFAWSVGLTGVYFEGEPPTLGPSGDTFWNANQVTIYYLPGTAGWTSTYGGRPTAIWRPSIQTADAAFGVHTNQFGFNISWASDRIVEIDASTSLDVPNWVPISTNTLPGGTSYFTDPDWTSYPARFYRVRSP